MRQNDQPTPSLTILCSFFLHPYLSMFFIKMRFLAVHIEGPFGAAPAPAPHQTECTIGSSGRWFLCEGPDKRPEGGEWELKIRFENREKKIPIAPNAPRTMSISSA